MPLFQRTHSEHVLQLTNQRPGRFAVPRSQIARAEFSRLGLNSHVRAIEQESAKLRTHCKSDAEGVIPLRRFAGVKATPQSRNSRRIKNRLRLISDANDQRRCAVTQYDISEIEFDNPLELKSHENAEDRKMDSMASHVHDCARSVSGFLVGFAMGCFEVVESPQQIENWCAAAVRMIGAIAQNR